MEPPGASPRLDAGKRGSWVSVAVTAPCAKPARDKGSSRRSREISPTVTIVRPAVRAEIDWKKEMTMSPEPKTLREWEKRKNIDRYSATLLTIDEASLSILLSIRTFVGWLLGLSVLGIVLLVILVIVAVSSTS